MAVRVTNVKGTFEDGRESEGFYMDGYLAQNLLGIPAYLRKRWDVVGIVSGHGKVRVGKSTIAFQIATLIAWLNAGGKIKMRQVKNDKGKLGWVIDKVIQPKEPLKFDLHENVCFSAIDLKETAARLYNKYGRNQVIVYDEGREGLEGARAMENLNKVMQDFFQECGFMGMVIIIVLPNFFKLHEDYAVARSLFLVDAFTDKNKNRGFYNFYNERQKEWLYFLGKKRIGISFKYAAANESFWGKFTSWFPFDRQEYDRLKANSMNKRALTRTQKKQMAARDAAFYLLHIKNGWNAGEIQRQILEKTKIDIPLETVKLSLSNEINRLKNPALEIIKRDKIHSKNSKPIEYAIEPNAKLLESSENIQELPEIAQDSPKNG